MNANAVVALILIGLFGYFASGSNKTISGNHKTCVQWSSNGMSGKFRDASCDKWIYE